MNAKKAYFIHKTYVVCITTVIIIFINCEYSNTILLKLIAAINNSTRRLNKKHLLTANWHNTEKQYSYGEVLTWSPLL